MYWPCITTSSSVNLKLRRSEAFYCKNAFDCLSPSANVQTILSIRKRAFSSPQLLIVLQISAANKETVGVCLSGIYLERST